jgi:peroxiredoxin
MSSNGTPVPLPPGTPAPDFSLNDLLGGETFRMPDGRGQIVVLNFWSGECAWSRQYDAFFERRVPLWARNGVRLLHISSNDSETPESVREKAAEYGVSAPVLHDVGNIIADAYGAATTPHIFVIDAAGIIAYQGAVDDRTFRRREADVCFIDEAVRALLAGRRPDPAETLPYGCAIVRRFD